MTTSRRFADRKVDRFEKNITKIGAVPETTVKEGTGLPCGTYLAWVLHICGHWLISIPNYPDSNNWGHGIRQATFKRKANG